ncbi:N-acetylglucosamine-6-phosphate deacetylase [Chelatococcus sp. GCM10030263]|uniref:N-acetylglucosamine-6-phosphate deacetylase n=1 Tax=Chelatococcus sp. GCM10030263 TaxID=3273387 RepID=UPI003612313C
MTAASSRFALIGAEVFDGRTRHHDQALIVEDGQILGLSPARDIPADFTTVDLDGGLLTAGFVDLQVNGGGGVQLNAKPTAEGIRAIAAAHARHGTTALLPTVITDDPVVTYGAVTAVRQAIDEGVPGCLGLHMEGPFLSPERKGAHDPAHLRSLNEGEQLRLTRTGLPHLLVTVAPEVVGPEQIAALVAAGITVSIGHSNAGYDEVMAAAAAGARCVTHLFNAMSPLTSREPGVVGAALASEQLWCSIIADGHHVHPATLAAAMRAKRGLPFFLVSDAMATAGSEKNSFTLNGRKVTRKDGRLTLEDGTLAGSDLVMLSAVRFMVETVGVGLEEALRMASLYPAMALGISTRYGRLMPGRRADILHLGDDLDVRGVWIGGERVAG